MKWSQSILFALAVITLSLPLRADWGDDWSEWKDDPGYKAPPGKQDPQEKQEEDSEESEDQKPKVNLDDIWRPGKRDKQDKYMYFDVAGLGGVGVDLRVGLAYALTPNDEEQLHRLGFDLAAGVYTQILYFRSANYFHFESAFGIGQAKEDQFRFGFRNDFLYHSLRGLDWGIGGSVVLFQIAATSHDNEVMWNPELALVADIWHFSLRLPVQFYAGSEPGVGFGPTFAGYFQ